MHADSRRQVVDIVHTGQYTTVKAGVVVVIESLSIGQVIFIQHFVHWSKQGMAAVSKRM